jgi:hypothetical protein
VPGVGRSSNAALSARHRLWLAPDHLLSVCNQGYFEDYKRFYFRDIQAITLRQTCRGLVISGLLGTVALAFGAVALYGQMKAWDGVGVWVLAGHATAFLLFLLINMAMGPTCVCTLRTAVQTERLYSLIRVRKALRALRLIREAVDAVQGTLSPEGVEAYAAQAAAGGTPTTARSHQGALRPEAGIKPYQSRAHAVLFSVLLFDMYHSLLQFVWQSKILYALSIMIMLALVGSLIVAAIRQSGTGLPRGLKITTWWGMGYVCVSQVVGVIVGVMLSVGPGAGSIPAELAMLRMWKISPFDSMPVMVMLVFSTVCSGTLGAAGWAQLRAFYRRRRPPPLAAVPPRPPA